MKQFTRFDPPDIAVVDREQCDGRAAAIDKLNFVCRAIFVHMDDGADLSR